MKRTTWSDDLGSTGIGDNDPLVSTLRLLAEERARADRAEAEVRLYRQSMTLVQAELDAIKERREEVGQDEGWWVGGAWGDYGEAVVPLRILSYVIDGELNQKIDSIDPGFALTYAEQVSRADKAESFLDRILYAAHVPYGPTGVSGGRADVDYLREAARKIEEHYKPFGSNLRATVVELLREVAFIMEELEDGR